MQNDVIIIGGGLGGLFTGALLAREGLSVTIVEKNAAIGGGLQTFHRFAAIWASESNYASNPTTASHKSPPPATA